MVQAYPINSHGYESIFTDWDTRSTVRTRPRRMIEEVDHGMVLFSPPLAPCVSHPLLQERGRAAVDEFLTRRLYLYLDFTTILEQGYINPTLMRIGRGNIGVRFSEEMRLDAHRIYCDEAYHALFSADLKHQVEVCTRTPATVVGWPRFTDVLREAKWHVPSGMRPLVEICFAVVSETLISGVLSGIPADPSVVTAVRESIADHAVDERKHHAYFTKLMEDFWPQLGAAEQRTLGPLFADFIIAFLGPDLRAQGAILRAMLFDPAEARQILADTHPAADVGAAIRQAARYTIRLLERVGVLRDGGVYEHFLRLGLTGDDTGQHTDAARILPSAA